MANPIIILKNINVTVATAKGIIGGIKSLWPKKKKHTIRLDKVDSINDYRKEKAIYFINEALQLVDGIEVKSEYALDIKDSIENNLYNVIKDIAFL